MKPMSSYFWGRNRDDPILDLHFKSNDIFEVHLHCSMYQHFIPFCGQIISHCIYYILFIHLSADGNLGCFNFLAIVNNAKHSCICFCVKYIFISLKYMPRIAMSCGEWVVYTKHSEITGFPFEVMKMF